MRTYTYRAEIEPGDERGFVVSFPDIPEAITQGDDLPDAVSMAEEVLGLALLDNLERGRDLPLAPAAGDGEASITVSADVAAKLAVLEAFAEAGITRTELAKRLGKSAREVGRILDPGHPTELPALVPALRALGRRLVVGVEKAA